MSVWTTPSAIHSKCGDSAEQPASNTKDEDTDTFWRHGSLCYHWIIFDLGQTYTISKIRLYQYSVSIARWGKTNGLDVYVSDDPTSWDSAVWTGVLNASGWQESGSFSKNGRYVKLVSKDNPSAQRMYEFDAYCAAVGAYSPSSHLSGRSGGINESMQGGIGR